MIHKARMFAQEWHGNQMYGDKPYSTHLAHVETKVIFLYSEYDHIELLRLTAVLHDILEDTACTEINLRECFSHYPKVDKLISALIAITKKKHEHRDEYLYRCAENPIALDVKIADTLCNLECSIRSGEANRINKYLKQIHLLNELKG
ncbi:hypothetical protein D2H34_004562 [Vibrio fluvialis]